MSLKPAEESYYGNYFLGSMVDLTMCEHQRLCSRAVYKFPRIDFEIRRLKEKREREGQKDIRV